MNQRIPTMAEVIRKAIDARLATVHTMLPGVVQSYDAAKQTASVQIAVRNTIETENGEETIAFPLLTDVPVSHPRAGVWFVHFPLSPGDHVVLHFGERALDQFRLLGADQAVLDFRKHDISDAIAYPVNLYPDNNPLVVSANTLSIGRVGGSTIHIKADGSVNIGSETPTDAIATANKVATELNLLKAALLADAVAAVAASGLYFGAAVQTLLNGVWPSSVASTKGKVDP